MTRRYARMNISLNLKDLLIFVLIILAIVLIVYLIALVIKLMGTLRKADSFLDDANRISTIAAEKTERLDGVIDDAADAVMGIVESVQDNSSLISRIASIGTGAMAVKAHSDRKRSKREEASLARAKARKSRKCK